MNNDIDVHFGASELRTRAWFQHETPSYPRGMYFEKFDDSTPWYVYLGSKVMIQYYGGTSELIIRISQGRNHDCIVL
jgi:hypothetical protein